MANTPPAHLRYFQACQGRWRSKVSLTITDWRAFWGQRMTILNRNQLLFTAFWPPWLGPVWLETSVAVKEGTSSTEVIHTTRALWLGLILMDGIETIELSEDGSRFVMHGRQSSWPFLQKKEFFEATGFIDESATRGTYDIPWMGTTLHQTTVAEQDLVTITQQTPWSHGVQYLRRQG
jgi:hypothetical protein